MAMQSHVAACPPNLPTLWVSTSLSVNKLVLWLTFPNPLIGGEEAGLATDFQFVTWNLRIGKKQYIRILSEYKSYNAIGQ